MATRARVLVLVRVRECSAGAGAADDAEAAAAAAAAAELAEFEKAAVLSDKGAVLQVYDSTGQLVELQEEVEGLVELAPGGDVTTRWS